MSVFEEALRLVEFLLFTRPIDFGGERCRDTFATHLIEQAFIQASRKSKVQGWLYLATVMDAYSRKIVGWSIGARMTQNLVLEALEKAFKHRKPEPGLIHHSDRGSQYAAKAYQRRLWRYRMIPSMSLKGNCWDNSPMESFFHTLKTEHVYFETFRTRKEAKSSIFEYIEVYCKRQRSHSLLGFVSPECHEEQLFVKYG